MHVLGRGGYMTKICAFGMAAKNITVSERPEFTITKLK